MRDSTRTIAIIVAAGKGVRSGLTVPKQFAPLAGRAVVAHSHSAFTAHPAIDDVIVVHAPGQERWITGAIAADARALGGAERIDTVRAALEAVAAEGGAARVLIHDAARPFVPAAVIDRLLAALDTDAGAVPVLPVVDTVARRDDGTAVDRAGLVRVQTPQAFRFAAILDAHRRWPAAQGATDDAGMVRTMGYGVTMVNGDAELEKLTGPGDLAAAAARHPMETRVATGFDVHRLEDGEELWLGGVLIPHHQGLSGHSDADVALHAITDAVLGCIAAGDIGTHFPPSDPQWKGARSGRFLEHARSLVEAKGGRVRFVDVTLMCEAPKIGPHRAAMQARIAELLALSPDRVSVKATTAEKLGFTGRGEGIAAQAVATVVLPA